LAHSSTQKGHTEQVSTACCSGRVVVTLATRPLPQAVLTFKAWMVSISL
jgi:hypothetical protein